MHSNPGPRHKVQSECIPALTTPLISSIVIEMLKHRFVKIKFSGKRNN